MVNGYMVKLLIDGFFKPKYDISMPEKKYLQLSDIGSYTVAFNLSNYVWDIVIKWDFFAKDILGKQFARSVDSISANIAEGFGRYTKREKIQFYRYSFGSVKESQDWIEKAKYRNLLTQEQYEHILFVLNALPRELNSLIKYTNEKLTM